MRQKKPRKKIALNIEHCKRLLRVRGLEEYENPAIIENELRQVMAEASAFYHEIRRLNLVFGVIYVRRLLSVLSRPYRVGDIHIPAISWVRWQDSERFIIYDWDVVSKMLDQANVSLDERLLHMRIHAAMRDFTCRARSLAEALRSAYAMQGEVNNMLTQENMSLAQIPLFIRKAVI